MTTLPNPFLNSETVMPVSGSAGATPCPQPRAPAAQISVSDGALFSSPPQREMELSVVTAAHAPSETEGAVSRAASSDKIKESSIAMEVPSEAPASAPTKNPDVGALGTDCISEIFFYARKLMRGHRASMCPGCENPEFVYETVDGGALYRCADCGKSVHFSAGDLAAPPVIDEATLEASIDEAPLFLREDGYLQRREA